MIYGRLEYSNVEQIVRESMRRAMFADEQPTIQQAADLLGMSRRTLQRRLEESDLSYRVLLDDTRRQLAECYLRDPKRQAKEISIVLGFAEQSSFTRAFRRWTGVAPSQFVKTPS
jgi:AraC-like DNA-binding protein